MEYIIYFILSICATSVGSMTGMGGGVLMKPLMDVLGDFDVQTIGILSSVTVFSMALVSVVKQVISKTKIPFATAIPLAVGSIVGGYTGEKFLSYIVNALKVNSYVTAVQNIFLSALILFVYVYMKNKSKIKGMKLSSMFTCFAVGVILGIFSSFLGIGGGPINVALIIYLFSFSTKTATISSLVTILFAQISKLATVAFTTGFSDFNLKVLPLMIIGAVAGGFIGASLNKKCSEKTVEKAFNAVQLAVLAVTVFNITRSFMG